MSLALTDNTAIDKEAILKSLNLNVRDPKTQALLLICERYELDPLMKHIVLISGNPYVTRDGYLALAHRSGQFDGIEIIEQGSDGTHWTAKVAVYRKDMGHPFTYTGRYPKSGHMKQYGPEMAVKVAEVQALRRAFNVTGVGAADERWDEDAEKELLVDKSTGEITTPQERTSSPSPRVEAAQSPRGLPAASAVRAGGGEPSTPPPAGSGGGDQGASSDNGTAAINAAPPATNLPPLPGEDEEPAVGSADHGNGATEPTADDEFDTVSLANRKAKFMDRLRALPADLAKAAVAARDAQGFPKVDALTWEQSEDFQRKVLVPIEKDAKDRTRSVVLACKKVGLTDDDERHGLILFATDGAVSSAKDLTEDQAAAVRDAAARVGKGELKMLVSDDGVQFLPSDMVEVVE